MYAKIAATYIGAFCRETFDKDPDKMQSTVLTGAMMDVFANKGYGTHKYIPAAKLTQDLNLPDGAGVYGFWLMADDSYLLLTNPGAVAYWSGKDEDSAQWVKPVKG